MIEGIAAGSVFLFLVKEKKSLFMGKYKICVIALYPDDFFNPTKMWDIFVGVLFSVLDLSVGTCENC